MTPTQTTGQKGRAMDAQQFAYWLQGFAELNEQPPTPEQWKSIREHLATVFVKVTPPVHSPSQIWPGTVTPLVQPFPPDPHRYTKPMLAECKGGSLSAGGGAIPTC